MATSPVPTKQDVLDLLITQELFSVAFVSAAIEVVPGTPSETFQPVLRSAVTAEYDHAVALENAGANAFATNFWVPDAAFDRGGVGLWSSIEAVESIEVSMYLIGVSVFADECDSFGARMCAEAMGTEAVHRALARFAQAQLGKDVGLPNDGGFENFNWQSIDSVRESLEALGIGYGHEGAQPGKFYEYRGDPVANGVGTRLEHQVPA